MADLVSDNPTTIVLKFEPSGRKGVDDPFNISGKQNICVVCGTHENLSRHHVIPHCIVKHLPLGVKSHNSHDVVAMCIECHATYEDKSFEKKKDLAAEAGISVHGSGTDELRDKYRIRSLATAIVLHSDKMPAERQAIVLDEIIELMGRKPNHQELVELSLMDPKKEINYMTFGKFIANHIEDHDEFAKSWRQHFLDTMQPKYMVAHWRVDRKFEEDWLADRKAKSQSSL